MGSATDTEDWLSRMKRTEKKVAIFYGSQTGTAEEYAQRLVKDARA
jgi:NADPH-ferrihemoprotein reductase